MNRAIVGQDYEELIEVSDEISQLIHFVSQQLAGREEVIQQSFYAFLTGENQLLLSRTGMAKSLLARQIFTCFEGVRVFTMQLTKDTMPDNLFGAYDIEAMKKGKMIHNIQGSILDSDFAFLDEIFDANDMVLRSLLSLLNEKQLVNGEQIVDSRLHSVIATANYIRATEVMEAVLDRFLYKSYIQQNIDLYYKFMIDQIYRENTGKVKLPEVVINLNRLRKIKQKVKSKDIYIPEYILFLKNYILRHYIQQTRSYGEESQEYTISDRTAAKTQDLLRASAILAGRKVVDEQDLHNLYYLVCTLGKPEEKDRLETIIQGTKRHFTEDRDVLSKVFNLIKIFNTIKSSENLALIMQDSTTLSKIQEIEQSFADSLTLRDKLRKITEKFISSNHTGFSKIIRIFQEACDVMKEIACRKETLEIIRGFEQDIEEFYKRSYARPGRSH